MAVIRGGHKVDAALAKIARGVARASVVNVGFLEGATYPNGTPVPMVAAIQEFGAPKVGIPPRPYFRGMVGKESPHWGSDVAKVLKRHDYDAAAALGVMGAEIKGDLQQSIRDLTSPPLKLSTIKRKGFAKPLVDTGHMLNSVDYEVKS